MPLHCLLAGGVFMPDDKVITKAFDDVARRSMYEMCREVMAIRVIELAREGEKDPDRLRDRILYEANAAAHIPTARTT